MSENIGRILENNGDISNEPPTAKQDCTDVVHISLFFDGTGNNKDADEEKKKWSNPARLWRNSDQLVQEKISNNKSMYAIYVSGVGTKFNGELNIFQRVLASAEDKVMGLGAGTGGTRRLDYGKDQFNDALAKALIHEAKKANIDLGKYTNEKKNYSLSQIDEKVGAHRLIKKINFSIFGFSRGAALARAFTNQLMWKCEDDNGNLTYGKKGQYSMEFKFLGLFDTVASFGLPATNLNNNLSYEGRDLVVDDRVKMCVHYIAGNELRFAFPVDLIEKDGKLAKGNWKEVVYPGMHSDVGGGYIPGSQDVNDNYARIPLKDMLTDAINAGVKMYSYDELKIKYKTLFKEQYEITPETLQSYEAVKKAVSSSGASIRDQIKEHMKVYYSAYGTMNKKGIDSVSQRVRQKDTIRNFIPWGPADMATEMKRLQTLKQGSATYKVI